VPRRLQRPDYYPCALIQGEGDIAAYLLAANTLSLLNIYRANVLQVIANDATDIRQFIVHTTGVPIVIVHALKAVKEDGASFGCFRKGTYSQQMKRLTDTQCCAAEFQKMEKTAQGGFFEEIPDEDKNWDCL